MRKHISLTNLAIGKKQEGVTLFIVLMVMVVIALLIVTASQSYNTEQRISTNDADRKLAVNLADSALREGELQIFNFEDSTVTFSAECTDGLCASPNTKTTDNLIVQGTASDNAWERKCGSDFCIDTKGREYIASSQSELSKNPRYIIEYVGNYEDAARPVYRITAKAWGRNPNTVVMLQSYVSTSE